MASVRSLLLLLSALTVPVMAAADGFQLISPGEYHRELGLQTQPGAKFVTRGADFNAPTITVTQPDTKSPVKPPVDIDVQFAAAAGATVDIKSLKILYGFLKLDITQRILQAPGVQVSASGLKASGATLPAGSHKLLIQVADNMGRVGRQPLEFTVAP
jgi:hypothetical protein